MLTIADNYDPTTGTFLTRDPLDGEDGTTTVANPYHYTYNDPLNRTDPLGLRPCDALFSAVAAIASMVSGTTSDPCGGSTPSGAPGGGGCFGGHIHCAAPRAPKAILAGAGGGSIAGGGCSSVWRR